VFDRVGFHVAASARTAVEGAAGAARDRGLDPCVLSTTVEGEARDAGGFHAAVAREVASTSEPVEPPAALLSAGETTVTVAAETEGTGGPNQEFVLGAAVAFADGPALPDAVDVAVAAVDTDGRDGSTDDAGAVLAADALEDPALLAAARDALAANDATGFFETYERECGADAARASAGGRLRSGGTGTNVNDLRVVVVTRR
jgi:glycerate 2-kinase